VNQIEINCVTFKKVKLTKLEGILYVTDQNNKKRFVQIDLEKYGKMWEDFYDVLMVETVKDEDSIPLEELGQHLKTEGLIDEL